jgi:hypothetical protein
MVSICLKIYVIVHIRESNNSILRFQQSWTVLFYVQKKQNNFIPHIRQTCPNKSKTMFLQKLAVPLEGYFRKQYVLLKYA